MGRKNSRAISNPLSREPLTMSVYDGDEGGLGAPKRSGGLRNCVSPRKS